MKDYRPSIPRNEHDSLVAEVSHLKKVNGSLEVDIDQSERRNGELVAEVVRLKCILELTTNLKQQSEAEVERLEQENDSLKKVIASMTPERIKDWITIKKLMEEKEQLSESVRLLSDEYNRRLEVEKENQWIKAQLEEAKADKLYYREQVELISKDNEQLREALKKCDPFNHRVSLTMDGTTDRLNCLFCNKTSYKEYGEHAPDCEYVRLCKDK